MVRRHKLKIICDINRVNGKSTKNRNQSPIKLRKYKKSSSGLHKEVLGRKLIEEQMEVKQISNTENSVIKHQK